MSVCGTFICWLEYSGHLKLHCELQNSYALCHHKCKMVKWTIGTYYSNQKGHENLGAFSIKKGCCSLATTWFFEVMCFHSSWMHHSISVSYAQRRLLLTFFPEWYKQCKNFEIMIEHQCKKMHEWRGGNQCTIKSELTHRAELPCHHFHFYKHSGEIFAMHFSNYSLQYLCSSP